MGGRYDEAATLQRAAVEKLRRISGGDHPDTLLKEANFANTLAEQGLHAEAEALQRRVLEAQRRVAGAEHPFTIKVAAYLGNILAEEGKYEEAESLQREQRDALQRIWGPEHPFTLWIAGHLARTLFPKGGGRRSEGASPGGTRGATPRPGRSTSRHAVFQPASRCHRFVSAGLIHCAGLRHCYPA